MPGNTPGPEGPGIASNREPRISLRTDVVMCGLAGDYAK